LLFVSHYNYYRNFETLIRALSLLKRRIAPRTVKLFLTCELGSKGGAPSYRTETAATLIRNLGLENEIVELGPVAYHFLCQVYQSCDIYVTPAYAESFAHPLVEAMASGLSIVASDLAVHREICGRAAVYFPRFSPEALAERLYQTIEHPDAASRRAEGLRRSQDFSWSSHVDKLLGLARELAGNSAPGARPSPKRLVAVRQ
jgi:glycosyltransferase involved in cell wall biosynthesis